MTREERAFIRRIRTDPADLTARLVYADWLDERGDPRGSGHRWLAEAGKVPRFYAGCVYGGRPAPWTWWGRATDVDFSVLMRPSYIPLRLLQLAHTHPYAAGPGWRARYVDFATAYRALDAVAAAYGGLPAAVRRQPWTADG